MLFGILFSIWDKYVSLLLPLLLTLLSCNKDDDKPADPVDLLPPATQAGANTAGCLVDGEPFIPKGHIKGGNLRQYYDGKNFFIRILRKSDDNISTGVGVFLEGLDKPLEMGKINVLNIDFMGSITKTGLYHIGSAPLPVLDSIRQITMSQEKWSSPTTILTMLY